ncbi:MAG TPA: type II toxin-antitoxin system RelE/ParE family toxin [Xanthobacteraceae bacterium]|jgi:addiction module RelE/StbE family toxin
MKVRYTPRAFADREAIYDYLETRNPQGARNVQLAVVQAIRGLAYHPRLGQRTDKAGVYELIVPRRPYKVYYRVEGEEVWILHIRDARRRPWEGE